MKAAAATVLLVIVLMVGYIGTYFWMLECEIPQYEAPGGPPAPPTPVYRADWPVVHYTFTPVRKLDLWLRD